MDLREDAIALAQSTGVSMEIDDQVGETAWIFTTEELTRFYEAAKGTQAVDEFRQRIANKIEAMPFGDTAASFAVWIRNQE